MHAFLPLITKKRILIIAGVGIIIGGIFLFLPMKQQRVPPQQPTQPTSLERSTQMELFFGSETLQTHPAQQIPLSNNNPTNVELFLDTKGKAIEGFDFEFSYSDSLHINSIADGADTRRFPVEIFSSIDIPTRIIRLSRVTTDPAQKTSGVLHIATLTVQGNNATTGSISLKRADIASTQMPNSTVSEVPTQFTIVD